MSNRSKKYWSRLVTDPSVPIIIGIIVVFFFHYYYYYYYYIIIIIIIIAESISAICVHKYSK